MRVISTLLYLTMIFWMGKSISLAQLFGLDSVLKGLVILDVAQNPYSKPATTYLLTPNINTFLQQFPTLTDFCTYKCGSIFNLPCFILFSCNIQIRNFVLLLLAPIILLIFSGLCCSQGVWTYACWGIRLLIWGIRKCAGGGSVGDGASESQKGTKNGENNNKKIQDGIDKIGDKQRNSCQQSQD